MEIIHAKKYESVLDMFDRQLVTINRKITINNIINDTDVKLKTLSDLLDQPCNMLPMNK